jgi:hypothetical protein
MRTRVVRGTNGEILAAIAEDPQPQVFAEPASEAGLQSEVLEAPSGIFADPENLAAQFSEKS